MPETLKIAVDYGVQKALDEGRQLAGVIADQAQKTATLAQNVATAEKAIENLTEATAQAVSETKKDAAATYDLADAVKKTGTAAQQAAPQIGGVTQQTQTYGVAASAASKGTGAMVYALTQVHTQGTAAAQTIHQVTQATNVAAQAANSAADSAIKWAKGYLGLQGVLTLMQKIAQASREAVEAQKAAVEGKIGEDAALRVVQKNFGLFGPDGLAKARDMADRLRTDTTTSLPQAAYLLASAQSVGMAPGTKGGYESTKALGQLVAFADLQPPEIEGLTKMVAKKNIQNDPKAIKDFLGRIYRAFNVTGSPEDAPFIRAVVNNMSAATDRGMPENEAMAMMSAYVTTSATAEGGADRFKMLMGMAEGASPKVSAFLAKRAASQGVTKPKTATIRDVEEMAAGGDEDKKGKLHQMREYDASITKADRELAEAEKDRDDLQNSRSFRHIKDPIAREKAVREADDRVKDLRARRTQLDDNRTRTRATAIGEIQSEYNVQAFRSLPISKTIPIYQKAMAEAATDPATARELAEELGGRREMVDAARQAAQPGFQAKYTEALGAITAPGAGAEIGTMYQKWSTEGSAERMRGDTTVSQNRARSVGTGGEMADLINRVSDESWGTDIGQRNFFDRLTGGGGINLTKDDEKARALGVVALNYFDQFWNLLTAEERSKYHGKLADISARIGRYGSGYNLALSTRLVRAALKDLGELRAEVMADRKKRGDKRDFSMMRPIAYRGQNIIKQDYEIYANPEYLRLSNNMGGGTGYSPESAELDAIGAGGPGAYFEGEGENRRLPADVTAAETEIRNRYGKQRAAQQRRGATTQPTGARSDAGGMVPGGGAITYNLNVGNYFSTSGGDMETPGRLEDFA